MLIFNIHFIILIKNKNYFVQPLQQIITQKEQEYELIQISNVLIHSEWI